MSGENISVHGAFQACIIASPDEAARESAAYSLAAALVCERGGEKPCGVCTQCRLTAQKLNPDVIELARRVDDKGKQKREIAVEQVRDMAADAWVRPQKAERKVYVIKDAGFMNDAAQNAALKLLEEPPLYASFILCAPSAESLLQTIRSRCVIIRPGGEEKREENPLSKEYISLAEKGSPAQLCSFFGRNDGLDSEALADFIAGVKAELCLILAGREKRKISRTEAARLLRLCERAEEYMRLNVGVKHILGLFTVLTV